MAWIIGTVLAVVLLVVIVLAGRPMKIQREPDREGIEDTEAAPAYDRASRWPVFALGRRIVLKALTQYRPQGVLVDIGCGPGYLAARISRRFPGLRVIGVDTNDQVLTIAKHNWPSQAYPNVEFSVGDAQQLPFADGVVDFAISTLSLHHWANAAIAVRELHRVLRPGGQFLLFDLRRDSPRFIYYGLRLWQALLAPAAIRRTNGAVGSFWASYTPSELKAILATIPLQEQQIQTGLGWVLAWGRKAQAAPLHSVPWTTLPESGCCCYCTPTQVRQTTNRCPSWFECRTVNICIVIVAVTLPVATKIGVGG